MINQNKKRKKQICIFEYTDFRVFLKEYYEYYKSQTKFFSYRYFSQKAGFSSHNVLKFVIQGQRNIAADSIDKFAHALFLNDNECSYFRLLVNFGQTKDEAEKNELFREMLRYRQVSEVKKIDKLQYEMYSVWYYAVVREMITLRDFTEDHAAIARMLSPEVRPYQVKKAITVLEKLGLIKRDENGKWVQTDTIIKTEPEVTSLSIRNFNRTMIQRADKALSDVAPERREISGMTVAMSKKQFQLIKEKIQRFKDDLLCELANDTDPSEEVYQVNFQMFPLLKKDRQAV
jgi:uncharacterized protein (TIGR02147 family)